VGGRADDPLDEGVLPAALIPHAGTRLDRAVAVEPERDRRPPSADVPHAHREPRAASGRSRLRGTDLDRGALEECAEVGSVPWLAGRRGIAGPGDVAP